MEKTEYINTLELVLGTITPLLEKEIAFMDISKIGERRDYHRGQVVAYTKMKERIEAILNGQQLKRILFEMYVERKGYNMIYGTFKEHSQFVEADLEPADDIMLSDFTRIERLDGRTHVEINSDFYDNFMKA